MPTRRSSRDSASVGVSIRPMRPADLDAVLELDARVFGEPRRAYFARRLASLDCIGSTSYTLGLVGEMAGEVVGLVMGTLTSGEFGFTQITALIDSIAVAPAYQRHGVGERLAKAFLAEAAAKGAYEVYTLVNWNAWGMLKFFDALGFGLASTVPLHRYIS